MDSSDATSTARTAVLDSPELLEMVLVLLPIRDLLLSQCVSRTFRDLITSSTTLQRHLFFFPISSQIIESKQEEVIFTTNDAAKLDITSAAISAEGCITPSGHVFRTNPLMSTVWPEPTTELINAKFNTLKIESILEFKRGAWQSLRLCVPTKGTPKSPRRERAHAAAIAYPQASWRRMYLTQPPVYKPICMSNCCTPVGECTGEDGITLSGIKQWEDKHGSKKPGKYAHLTLIFGKVEAAMD